MRTKFIKKGRGAGNSIPSSLTDGQLESILEEEIKKVPGKKSVDKREEMKDSYVKYLNDNYEEARESFDKLVNLNREFEYKELTELTEDQKRRLGKYLEDAINIRDYVNKSDLLWGLGEIKRIPDKSRSLNVSIITLYGRFPVLTMLGTQSPEESEDINQAVFRMRAMMRLDLNPMMLTLDEVKSEAMKKFVRDLKKESGKKGGRKLKTRKKRRKSVRKSRTLKKRRKTKKGKRKSGKRM
jgi:hypothetical protein